MVKAKTPLPGHILKVAQQLAGDVTSKIKPHSCIFGPTREGQGFHYTVRSAGGPCKRRPQEKLIAWAYIYKIGRRADTPRRPCLGVFIPCDLLGASPVAARLTPPSGGSYGDPRRPECQGVTYALRDTGYLVLLDALTTAANNWLVRR